MYRPTAALRRAVDDGSIHPHALRPAGINVRSGPGVNFPVVGSAAFNDEGEVVGRSVDNRWWAVPAPSLADGMGWVSADFDLAHHAEDVPIIVVAPPPAPESTAVPPATPTPLPAATATPAKLEPHRRSLRLLQ